MGGGGGGRREESKLFFQTWVCLSACTPVCCNGVGAKLLCSLFRKILILASSQLVGKKFAMMLKHHGVMNNVPV